MKQINPTHWNVQERPIDARTPIVSFINDRQHQFHIHPVDARLVRIVHSLPENEQGAHGALGGVPLRNHQKRSERTGIDGFRWEQRTSDWSKTVDKERKKAVLRCDLGEHVGIVVVVDYSSTITLTWHWFDEGIESKFAFLQDFKTAYKYDARTKRVFHFVSRDQSYVATSEHARSANENHVPQSSRFEYVYGLGECKGPMMKDGKRYVMEARDSLGADPQDTDPLYKITPYYLHYNSKSRFWFGLYYNTLVPSVFDFSGEHDFATGQFRSFSAERGPLDYYVLLGDASPQERPKPASIISQLARLVTPVSFGHAGRQVGDALLGWQTSPCLPPHNQFGYLASSLTMSERPDAQQAVTEYIVDARKHGFPIDSMHLSSGYCVDSTTGDRNYFFWDKFRYPDPAEFGRTMENELACTVIINVKPWLLESHPYYKDTARQGSFVRAAPDALQDDDRCADFQSFPSRTVHWARGMGDTDKGSYIDFSSKEGSERWNWMMDKGVLSKAITGLWIDNNEFNSLIDDEDEVQGTIDMWSLPRFANDRSSLNDGKESVLQKRQKDEVTERMGWLGGRIAVGAIGAASLTMGMARATFASLIVHRPNYRPVIVTRSAVPGIQAFAHSTWSGDNSTTWLSLKWSTKLSLSVALSFGLGLYGHDIGGFAGEHSPSAELLVRWCQQSMWMTRFTIHSWKPVTTTPWMYDDQVTSIIRQTIAFRYRLLPTLYSLYVTQYHRHGRPVVRPVLWHHEQHWECLVQDEQFLVGSHIFVAPVCDPGVTRSTFFLPHRSHDQDGIELSDTCWYELDTGRVHRPSVTGNQVTLDAPLERCPTLIREGGILVLGPAQATHIPSPAPNRRTYTVLIFPTPSNAATNVPKQVGSSTLSRSQGDFILFDDDGLTNEATDFGRFTELRLFFHQCVQPDGTLDSTVEVGVEIIQANHCATWDISFVLPRKDERPLRSIGHTSHGRWKDSAHVELCKERPGRFIITVD